MAELRITTDSTDPGELFAAYQDYIAQYERVCADIDALDRQLRQTDDPAEEQRLTAEMHALTDDSAVMLGWVAAAFAAFIFTTHETAWREPDIDAISPAFRPVDNRSRRERRRAGERR